MIAVIQRVKNAAVSVEGNIVGSCGAGLLILLGVAISDTEEDAKALARKIVNLRIFTDENDKLNLSVKDVCGEVLVVSNFTLLANYKKASDSLRNELNEMGSCKFIRSHYMGYGLYADEIFTLTSEDLN